MNLIDNTNQDSEYSICVDALIEALFKRIVKFYTNDICNENKFKEFLSTTLSSMQ